MGLLRDAQTWGGAFLGNYILYGVLMFIFMYIPINHVCMAIFRLHRFPLRRYDVIFGQNDVILAKICSINKGHSFCKNGWVDLKIGQHTSFDA